MICKKQIERVLTRVHPVLQRDLVSDSPFKALYISCGAHTRTVVRVITTPICILAMGDESVSTEPLS